LTNQYLILHWKLKVTSKVKQNYSSKGIVKRKKNLSGFSFSYRCYDDCSYFPISMIGLLFQMKITASSFQFILQFQIVRENCDLLEYNLFQNYNWSSNWIILETQLTNLKFHKQNETHQKYLSGILDLLHSSPIAIVLINLA